jgi:hypothetical protein
MPPRKTAVHTQTVYLILLESAPQAATAAEAHFCSFDWGRRLKLGALSWELRTSTSLARLQQDQGQTAEARSLRQRVYDRFSDGFETADLKLRRRASQLLAAT